MSLLLSYLRETKYMRMQDFYSEFGNFKDNLRINIYELTESFFIFSTKIRTCDGMSLKTRMNQDIMM